MHAILFWSSYKVLKAHGPLKRKVWDSGVVTTCIYWTIKLEGKLITFWTVDWAILQVGYIMNISHICNYYMSNIKYSKLIGRFLDTWPLVMVHTDSKYHIDQLIFSHIDCHYGTTIVTSYCTIVTLYCTIVWQKYH